MHIMMDYKHEMKDSFVIQPYIIASVLSKATNFRGVLEIEHKIY